MQQENRTTEIRSRAFALPELIALLAAGVVIVCLLAMVATDTRRQAGLHHSLSNLRQIGTLHHAYAADHSERIATFSWYPGNEPSEFPDLTGAATSVSAAANQAVDIIRRWTELDDMPPITAWLPHIGNNHLVFADYTGDGILDPRFISPGDRTRMAWLRAMEEDPTGEAYLALSRRPNPDMHEPINIRPALGGSFDFGAAFFSWPEGGHGAIRPASANTYMIPTDVELGRRSLDEVAHPSDKAMVFDRFAWYFGDVPLYSANIDARTPILAADGAARVRRTWDMNQGFRPASPTSPLPSTYLYRPNPDWQPPLRDGTYGTEILIGHHRWTRSGLRGRDFNGPEIPWED